MNTTQTSIFWIIDTFKKAFQCEGLDISSIHGFEKNIYLVVVHWNGMDHP